MEDYHMAMLNPLRFPSFEDAFQQHGANIGGVTACMKYSP